MTEINSIGGFYSKFKTIKRISGLTDMAEENILTEECQQKRLENTEKDVKLQGENKRSNIYIKLECQKNRV